MRTLSGESLLSKTSGRPAERSVSDDGPIVGDFLRASSTGLEDGL